MMKSNFTIKDATYFVADGQLLDASELLTIIYYPGRSAYVEMVWAMSRSNERVQITFNGLADFRISGRDEEYPLESGTHLTIAGFSSGHINTSEVELYLDETDEMNYMTFVMGDTSAFFIKAEFATLRRI